MAGRRWQMPINKSELSYDYHKEILDALAAHERSMHEKIVFERTVEYQEEQKRLAERRKADEAKMDTQGARKVWGDNHPTCATCPLYHPTNTPSSGRCANRAPSGDMPPARAGAPGCANHPVVAAVMDHIRSTALADHIAQKITGLAES